MSIPLISVRDLKKNFCTGETVTKVLNGISFDIQKGEFVSIMGPSGSGKSTLMHILGFLDKTTSGSYMFENKDTTKLNDNELARMRNKKIGFVFQAFNLLQRTSVLDNVKLPLFYSFPTPFSQAKATNQAKHVLKIVGLNHRMNYHTNQISGGEKQRVAIARALVNNPSIIFADEPTGNLDSKSGIQIMKILQKLNNEGNTIILVTHETYTSEHAKRIINIIDGKIISDFMIKKRKIATNGELLK